MGRQGGQGCDQEDTLAIRMDPSRQRASPQFPCFHVEQDTSYSASRLPTDHPKRVSAATDTTSQRLNGEQTGFIPEQVSAIQMRSYVRVA